MAHNGRFHAPRYGEVGWGAIVLLLFAVWPAGVYLLLRKLARDRVTQLSDGLMPIGVGGALIVLGLFNLYIYRAYELWIFGGGVFFYFAGGSVLLGIGAYMFRLSRRYREYIRIIANRSVFDIRSIACIAGVRYEHALAELQRMLARGYFHGAHIDLGSGRIMMPVQWRVPAPRPVVSAPVHMPAPPPSSPPREVCCHGCGANNLLHGDEAECEYCGGPLA